MASVISWILAHQGLVAGVLVSILDLVFALVPSWESNGLLHWFFLQIQGIANSPPPSAPAAPIEPKAS